jgi:hypothetical protein
MSKLEDALERGLDRLSLLSRQNNFLSPSTQPSTLPTFDALLPVCFCLETGIQLPDLTLTTNIRRSIIPAVPCGACARSYP